MMLSGVDIVSFIADSKEPRLESNCFQPKRSGFLCQKSKSEPELRKTICHDMAVLIEYMYVVSYYSLTD